MKEAIFDFVCSNEFLAALLVLVGILGHQVVRLKDRVIKETRKINHDLYRAIIFPYRKTYEADITGFASLFFYARFRKAILSRDFSELRGLRHEHRKIVVYTVILLVSVLLLLAWIASCKQLSA